MGNNFKKAFLLLGDILVLFASLYITLLLRYQDGLSKEIWQMHLLPFSSIFVFWLLVFYISDLYDLRKAVTNSRFMASVARSFAAASLFSVLFFYLSPYAIIAPKTNLAIFIAVLAVIFFVWRRLFNWALKSYLPKNNLAIIGRSPLAEEIIKELKHKPQLGYHLAFIMETGPSAEKEWDGIPVFDNLKDLPELLEKKKVSNVLLAAAPDSDSLRTILFDCLPLKITFVNLVDFYETIAGKIPIEVIGKMWFLENLNEGNKSAFDAFKRLVDLILALIFFTVSLPFWPLVAAIIKIESKGTVFFRQIRSGQGGQPFKMLKFRTMKTENNDHAPTAVNDPRVTSFGSFLRKSRLDEIPQLINIIKGDMSFVGPRPERPELIEALEKQIPFYRERMLVKPGVTGWDQISGEYHSPSYEDTMKKLQYDLYYVKNRSLYLDLAIILKTISTVLSRAGR